MHCWKLLLETLFVFSLVLILCSSCIKTSKPHFPKIEKIELASEIRQKVALQLKKEKGLVPVGIGSGMMDQIRMLALSFDYYKPVTIEEGRELLIAALNTFVDAVNAEERIHPYLQNYPFTPKNIEIRIFIFREGRKDLPFGELHCLSSINQKLEYETREPSPIFLRKILVETYEEAIAKLKSKEKKDF